MNRKHIITVCAFLLCAAVCIAAAAAWPRAEAGEDPETIEPGTTEPGTPEPGTTESGTEEPVLTPDEILPLDPLLGFHAQYLRTDGYHDGVKYPIVKIIRSVEEWNEYYEANKDRYNLSGFPAACEKYDETYFKDRILVLVLVEAGSGSVRYQVTGVTQSGEELNVDIDVHAPEVGTCDMAEWHILIEPEKGVDADRVQVNLRPVAPEPRFGLAYCSCGYASAALHIPEGWTYEAERSAGLCEGGSEEDGSFFIAFRPLDRTHCIVLRHFSRNPGVCGTGLEQKRIRLGDYEGWQGTYDGRKQWEYISIEGPEGTGSFFINNEAVGEWSDSEYRQAMEILATLEIGGGSPTESQAVEIAKTAVTVPFDYAKAVYDGEHGFWTVDFGRQNYAGGDQLVTVSDGGEIVDSAWGE